MNKSHLYRSFNLILTLSVAFNLTGCASLRDIGQSYENKEYLETHTQTTQNSPSECQQYSKSTHSLIEGTREDGSKFSSARCVTDDGTITDNYFVEEHEKTKNQFDRPPTYPYNDSK